MWRKEGIFAWQDEDNGKKSETSKKELKGKRLITHERAVRGPG